MCSIMFNPGLYFQTLDLTKTKVLLNLGLECFVIRAIEIGGPVHSIFTMVREFFLLKILLYNQWPRACTGFINAGDKKLIFFHYFSLLLRGDIHGQWGIWPYYPNATFYNWFGLLSDQMKIGSRSGQFYKVCNFYNDGISFN